MKTSNVFLRTIKIHKVENAMETSAEKAPYLGIVDSAGTVDTDAFIEEMIEDGGCTEEAAAIRRIIDAGDNALLQCVGEQQMKVYTGDGSLVSPFIYGSFDAPDASVGENNSVEPQVRLGSALRDAAADIVPEEDRSVVSSLGGVKIYSVLTEGVGFSTVVGVEPFTVAGYGFKPSETSTVAVSVTNVKTGVTTAALVTSVDSTQRVTAKLTTLLAAGDYQLTVTVTDGVGSAAKSATRKVSVLESDDGPKITGVKQDDRADGHLNFLGGSATITGVDILRPSPGDTVKLELYAGGVLDATSDLTAVIGENTSTKLVLSAVPNNSGKGDSYWADKDATLAMTLDGVRITYPVHIDAEA